jgi:hypothetical protein
MLAEEYDPTTGHHLGNTPQAFSLVGLVNTARHLIGSQTRTDQDPTKQNLPTGSHGNQS